MSTQTSDMWIDKLHSVRRGIDDSKYDLENIAHRLSSVGLDKIANEIGFVAGHLDVLNKLLNDGVNQILSDNLAASQESSNMIFKAILGGVFATPEERAAREKESSNGTA